jgi:glycosyltransferase involved in cell wall biosynthesis
MRWELLIIDDGSDDGTESFIKKYFLINKRIRYFKRAYNGDVPSKNFGIKNAVGNYITFLEPNDEILSNHIELRLNYLELNPEVDLITGGINLEKLKLENPDYYQTIQSKEDKESILGNLVLFGRRKVFELLSGFNDVEYYQTDFVVRALDHFEIRKVDFPTYIIHLD